jgi:hypothetical protein
MKDRTVLYKDKLDNTKSYRSISETGFKSGFFVPSSQVLKSNI